MLVQVSRSLAAPISQLLSWPQRDWIQRRLVYNHGHGHLISACTTRDKTYQTLRSDAFEALSTRIRTLLKLHIFHPDSPGRGFKPLWRAALKQYSFDDPIHWFRVNRRAIRVNKVCSFKNIRIGVVVATTTIEFLSTIKLQNKLFSNTKLLGVLWSQVGFLFRFLL